MNANPVTLARHAMATRFEIVIHGPNPAALRAAGEEALNEIERLEDRLSLYRPGSEISQVNARAAREPVRVTPEVFALLQRARRWHEATEGAFDITVAPLVRCWGFMGGNGRAADPAALADARAKVGLRFVHLDAGDFTVSFERNGMMLDLGAIGKGYAVEVAANLLRDAGVENALIHGGTSTVCGLGRPPEVENWNVAIERPRTWSRPSVPPEAGPRAEAESVGGTSVLAEIPLANEALSVSAVWGRSFESGGKRFGHVLDPRTGQPVDGAVLAAVALPSATDTDALSTALLVAGARGHEDISRLCPGMRTLLVTERGNTFQTEAHGIALKDPA